MSWSMYNYETDVDHPKRYNRGRIEAIDVIEDWGLNFSLGSVIKYICRLGQKDDPVEELEKCIWYLEREKAKFEKAGTEDVGDQMKRLSKSIRSQTQLVQEPKDAFKRTGWKPIDLSDSSTGTPLNLELGWNESGQGFIEDSTY